MKNILLILTVSIFAIVSCGDITNDYQVTIEKGKQRVVTDSIVDLEGIVHAYIEKRVDGYKIVVTKLFDDSRDVKGGYYVERSFVINKDSISKTVEKMKLTILEKRNEDVELIHKEKELEEKLNSS